MKTDGDQIIEGNLEVTGNITNNGVPITGAISSASAELIDGFNSFNPSLIVESSRVSNTNGSYISDGARDRTGKQKVTPNQRYYQTYGEFPNGVNQPESALRAYFDVNGDYIGDWANDALEADGSFIIPANVHYVEWAASKGGINSFTQLIKADDLVTPIVVPANRYTSPGKVFDPNQVNVIDGDIRKLYFPLKGKNWLLLGDSITLQAKYVVWVKKATGLEVLSNLGINGETIGQMTSTLTQQQVTDADVITILGGTNNYGHGGDPLGTIADDRTVNSTYGQIRKVLEDITGFIDTSGLTEEEKTAKLVCFCTPFQRAVWGVEPVTPAPGSGGKTLVEIVQAIKDVCAEFGVPVWDGYTLSGINKLNINSDGDNLHPGDSLSAYGLSWGRFLNNNYRGY